MNISVAAKQSNDAENPSKATSLASENMMVDVSGGGRRE